MVKLILNNANDNKFILKELKKNLASGGKHLVIVPDRIAMTFEMIVLDYLNIGGSFDIEVVSFSRLADLVLKKKAVIMLNTQTEVMLIRKVIEDNKAKLEYYKNSTSHVGFANEMQNIISSIRKNDIKEAKLNELIELLPVIYKKKAKDILLIYSEYVKYLQNNYFDSTSKIEALADELPNDNYSNYNIYISEFLSFSEIELKVIKSLINCAPKVYIGLAYSEKMNKHIYPISLVDKIKDIAKECDQKVEIENIVTSFEDEFNVIGEKMFSYKQFAEEYKRQRIQIFKTSDQENEVENIAEYIKKLIIKNNIRYKNIACVCCDLQGYSATIRSIFDKYDIPYYMDVKSQLQNQLIAKVLLGGIKVIKNNYMQQDVLIFISDLVGTKYFDHNQFKNFENYCLKYGIDFENAFKNDFVLKQDEDLVKLNNIRKKVIDILSPLEALKEASYIEEQVNVVKEFLTKIDAQELCDALADDQEKKEYKIQASITRQTLKKIDEILMQMNNYLKQTKLSLLEFYRIFESTIASQEISTIPMMQDCVYIGDCSKSRYERKECLIIMGANAGLFPYEETSAGFLSLPEQLEWKKHNCGIYPSSDEANNIARLNALTILLKPTKNLVLTYPEFDLSGDKLEPSCVIQYLKDILGVTVNMFDDIYSDDDVNLIIDKLISKKNMLVYLVKLYKMLNLKRAQQNIDENKDALAKVVKALYSIACDEHGKIKVDNILKNKEKIKDTILLDGYSPLKDTMGITSIESYFECPYKYLMQNVLKVKERDIAGVNAKDIGIILHKILEMYFKNYYEKNNTMTYFEIAEKEFDDFIKNNVDFSYLNTQDNHTAKLRILNNAARIMEVLTQKMEVTQFKPAGFEVGFGKENDEYEGLEVESLGKKVKFVGYIDRIDKYEDKFVIIDYKSKRNIEYKDSDITKGLKLQLIVYAKILMKQNLIPAGIFYLSLADKIVKNDDKSKILKCIGFANKEEVELLDKKVYSGEQKQSSLFEIIKVSDDFKRTKKTPALSKEDFENKCNYAEKLIVKALDEIQEGFIAPSPYDDEKCKYCSYKKLCGQEENVNIVERG